MLQKTIAKLEDFITLPPPKVSFEFFPPKTEKMEAMLWETVAALEPFQPEYVSVTYGAGGSTRTKTHQTVKRIKEETSLKPTVHLTCVSASKDEVNRIAREYLDMGVNHILALRGDPPGGMEHYVPHPDGYQYAVDMVNGLKALGDFEISVAAFPEKHPESKTEAEDLQRLKEKLDAGAKEAVTQYFFDTDVFLRFLDKARAIGIDKPIVPGILIISNFEQMVKFSEMCGATVPKWIYDLLEGLDAYPERRDMLSAVIAAEQCRMLREAGIDEFHFYTLNRAHITASVCHMLGIQPKG